VFPFTAALLAPAWVLERAVCIWLALGSRLLRGGVRYRDGVLKHAATPPCLLRRRHAAARMQRVYQANNDELRAIMLSRNSE
jgi:hypothetical protein